MQTMNYLFYFGGSGEAEGFFRTPLGVSVNAQNDIIIADSVNHRIQVFDKQGWFKFQICDCGTPATNSEAFLYPDSVAVVRATGDIIVTEKTPIPHILIYNQWGQFVRKFGAHLSSPQAVTVDNEGRIIVVEDTVNRVVFFDQLGNVLHHYDCHELLKLPNGIAVNDKQEIFISDYELHCVKVFNYEGQCLRQIGGDGITGHPFAVGLTTDGRILIAGNTKLHLKLYHFDEDGCLETTYKLEGNHEDCIDMALMDDNTVVLSSEDHKIHVYRYEEVPQQ